MNNTKLSFFQQIMKYYSKSLKPFQAEELLSFIFIRPIGFVIAMVSKALHITPNMISVVRGISALGGGIAFIIGTPDSVFIGAVIFFISNFFDSADGQLARIIEKPTELGLILDGVGDGISIVGIYLGSAVALSRNNPGSGLYWWIASLLAFVCFFIYIYTQGFLRYELYHYTIYGYVEPRTTKTDLKARLAASKKKSERIFLGFMIFFNTCLESVAGIVLLKNYKGYINWYVKANSVSQEKKEKFRAEYQKKNGWILHLFNNIAILSNQTIFIICALFNRLDIALYIVLIGCNLYYITLVIIQRINFYLQLKKL